MKKTKPKQKPKSQTVRVPTEFKSELMDYVSKRGMTSVGAFRVHGPAILSIVRGDLTAPATSP